MTLKVCTGKAGRISLNHAWTALKVRTGMKAGRIALNHSRTGLRIRAAIKGGRLAGNHNRPLRVA